MANEKYEESTFNLRQRKGESGETIVQQLWKVQIGESYYSDRKRHASHILVMAEINHIKSIMPSLQPKWCAVREEWRDLPWKEDSK